MPKRTTSRFSQNTFLALFLSVVLLGASIYRIFNFKIAIAEFQTLGFGNFSVLAAVLVIALELAIIAVLLFFKKYSRYALTAGLVFMLMAVAFAFIRFPHESFANMGALFAYNTEPTDIFLHITYAAIMVALLLGLKKED